MDYKITPYVNKFFNADILSYLNVDSEGDVVSAKTWKALWGNILNFTQQIDVHMTELLSPNGIITTLIAEHNRFIEEHALILADYNMLKQKFAVLDDVIAKADANVQQALQASQIAHDAALALGAELIHYGDMPPTNPYTKLWVRKTVNTDLSASLGDVAEAVSQMGLVLDNKINNVDGELQTLKNGTLPNNYYNKTEVDEKTAVDQTYNANSKNAQSGKAVAEAVEQLMPKVLPACSEWYDQILVIKDIRYDKNEELSYKYSTYPIDRQHEGTSGGLEEPDCIPIRNYNACLTTNYPSDEYDCTNKAYVDGLVGDIAITVDQTYNAESENAQSGKAVAEAITGQKTADGGEIFNDYDNNKALSKYSKASGENNIAGVKVFYITAWNYNAKTYTLDSVEGLAVDDVVSIKWGGSYINFGKITAIDTEKLIITTDNFAINDVGDPNTTLGVLFVVDKPTIGLHSFDDGQHVEGTNNVALLWGSHAEGYGNVSADRYAHTEGIGNIAYYAAHAEGCDTHATGKGSHAEGYNTKATSFYSHAEGKETKATGTQSHAEGYGTNANGDCAHAEGCDTNATGVHSHAEGHSTQATGQNAHAEGLNTQANGECTHAEGNGTKAIGHNSHAEGSGTEASGDYAHTEGYKTKAKGKGCHAEGHNTQAANYYSHAEGNNTQATGNQSHAGGLHTIAGYNEQTVIGRYNNNKKDTLFEVGCGASEDQRENCFEAGKNQNGKFVRIGNTQITEDQLKQLLTLVGGTIVS